MDGHAVTGQNISAVIIQEGRHEVHLDVGPVIGSMPADNEAACFCNIGSAGAFFPKKVAQARGKFVELVVGDGFPAMEQRADIQVVLEVLTDAGQIVPHLDTMHFQVISGPDA